MSQSHKGRKHTPETIRRISEGLTGLKRSEATRQKMSQSSKGQKHTPETIRRMTGLKRSEAARQKMSQSQKGRKLAPETIRRISEARAGTSHSLVTRFKMHVSAVGRQLSAETRLRISQAQRERHARRKAANGSKQAAAAPARPTLLTSQQIPDSGNRKGVGLVVEKAVAEMAQLRQEIAQYMAAYQREHGVRPRMEDASPELYDKFVRFVTLRDYVRDVENQLL